MFKYRYLNSLSVVLAVGCSSITNSEEAVVADLRHDYENCHVHDQMLLEDMQPVAWETRQAMWWHEREKLFPFAQDDIWLSGRERTDFAKVMYCPECRRVKSEWQKLRADPNQDPWMPLTSEALEKLAR